MKHFLLVVFCTATTFFFLITTFILRFPFIAFNNISTVCVTVFLQVYFFCCLSGRKTTTAAFARGGKSENIRLNQMQIERFAVGNFQFSSPCLFVCVYVCLSGCVFRIRFTIETRFDTGKTNLELIFCRRVSFRFGRSVGTSSRSLSLFCLWMARHRWWQKWVAPAWSSSFASSRQDSHVNSFVRVCVCMYVCAFNYFLPWRSLLIITRWQLLRTEFSLSSQAADRQITNWITQISFFFFSLLKQLTFGLSNCDSSGTRISS